MNRKYPNAVIDIEHYDHLWPHIWKLFYFLARYIRMILGLQSMPFPEK